MSTRLGAKVAYISLAAGGGLSIAGNVADTYRVTGGAANELDYTFAIGAPGLTLLAIELFVHPVWNREEYQTGGFRGLRWVGLTGMALVAAYVSWHHLSSLLLARGQGTGVAYSFPFAIDGVMVMATAVILMVKRARLLPPEVAPLPTAPEQARSSGQVAPEQARSTEQSSEHPEQRSTPAASRSWSTEAEEQYRKAVRMLLEQGAERSDLDVAELCSMSRQTVQRIRRAVRVLRSDPTDHIPTSWKVRPEVVAIIREEITK